MSLRINDIKIDWSSSDSHYFFNPRHPQSQKLKRLAKTLPFFKGHIYLLTSGEEKICLLSKEAFLHSAQAVNKNLQTQKKDRWLISLPLFHVGGLSILARAFVGKFFHEQGFSLWKARLFQQELKNKKISLSSLVPTQLYDLIRHKLKAPPSLRALIIGGEALSPFLYKKAKSLNWPVLISYGLTEACSQVTCSPLSSLSKKKFPDMNVLDHIQIKSLRSKIKIKSESLLTACFDIQNKTLYDPKDSKGWLELPDKAILKKRVITIIGRRGEEIKILGERVNLQKLFFLLKELSQNFSEEYHLAALPDARQGFKLNLITSCFDFSKASSVVKNFNKKVLPFERIENIYFVPKINKSQLFKIQQKQIRKQLGL